ncbi:hypothetical protein LIER_37624 [Lithospermum erythrorhizon]|uniref:Protein kinase domain-containing protein n=1 Tax=Lithospermum erythrorhizon TaxID=34254 RepID=A0AAV3PPW7_LITER
MRRDLRLEHRSESDLAFAGFDSMCLSTTLVEFSYEENGSLVAFKRFKKLSEDGEAEFMHELEVIASVRHVNLVALRGYCTVSTRLKGYQRILVCALMENGSLHDQLFSSSGEKLS